MPNAAQLGSKSAIALRAATDEFVAAEESYVRSNGG
jgi:hypothetical protein